MEPIKEGVWNLVNHCAEVKKEDEVLTLNEYGKVDEEITALSPPDRAEVGEAGKQSTLERGPTFKIFLGDLVGQNTR